MTADDLLFWGCTAGLVVATVLLVRYHVNVWRATRRDPNLGDGGDDD